MVLLHVGGGGGVEVGQMFNAESLLGQVRKMGIHVLQDFAHFVQTGEEVYKVFEALKEE